MMRRSLSLLQAHKIWMARERTIRQSTDNGAYVRLRRSRSVGSKLRDSGTFLASFASRSAANMLNWLRGVPDSVIAEAIAFRSNEVFVVPGDEVLALSNPPYRLCEQGSGPARSSKVRTTAETGSVLQVR